MADEVDHPKNAFELAKQLEVPLDEGVVVALFPEKLEEVSVTAEEFNGSVGIIGKLGPWGPRLLDLDDTATPEVKWWRVKEFAKMNGYDLIPTRYEGPIGEIPDRYFNEGTILGVRFYQTGPWFWPLEQPKVETEEGERLSDVVDTLNAKGGYNA